MEGGYILTKDLPAERTASGLVGLRTSRKSLRGELLLAIRGHDLVSYLYSSQFEWRMTVVVLKPFALQSGL